MFDVPVVIWVLVACSVACGATFILSPVDLCLGCKKKLYFWSRKSKTFDKVFYRCATCREIKTR